MVECLRCARLESAAHPTASRVAPAEAAAVSDPGYTEEVRCFRSAVSGPASGGYKFLTY